MIDGSASTPCDDVLTYTFPKTGSVATVYTRLSMDEIVRRLPDPVVNLDIETNGLFIGSEFKIRLVQFGRGLTAYTIPFEGNEDAIRAFLMDPTRTWVTHRGIFDWVGLGHMLGFDEIPGNVEDTAGLGHHWDNRRVEDGGKGHGLAGMTAQYVCEETADKIKGSMAEMAKSAKMTKAEMFANIDLYNSVYQLYAGMDVVLGDMLFEHLKDKLAQSPVHSPDVYEHDIEFLRAGIYMGVRGMKMDINYLHELQKELSLVEDEHNQWLATIPESPILKVGSPKQVTTSLMTSGIKLTETTKTGNLKADKLILTYHALNGSGIAERVLKSKRASKWRVSYVGNLLSATDDNRYMHSQLWPLGATTARTSMGSPAIQQMPSKSDLLRTGFTCEEDESIFTCDYVSQEVRAGAALSGDPQLIADLEAGVNPIKRLSIETHGTDKGRLYSATKNQIYAQSYGAGIPKLIKMTGMPESTVRKVRNTWREMYPVMYQCSLELEEEVKSKGYLVGVFGRPLIIPKKNAYKAFNAKAQNLGREIAGRGVTAIFNSPWRYTLKLFMHDEVVGVAKKSEVKEAMAFYEEVMAMNVLGIPFPVEAEETGNTWRAHYTDDDELLMEEAIEEALAIT